MTVSYQDNKLSDNSMGGAFLRIPECSLVWMAFQTWRKKGDQEGLHLSIPSAAYILRHIFPKLLTSSKPEIQRILMSSKPGIQRIQPPIVPRNMRK